jgi:hypothetical protein
MRKRQVKYQNSGDTDSQSGSELGQLAKNEQEQIKMRDFSVAL